MVKPYGIPNDYRWVALINVIEHCGLNQSRCGCGVHTYPKPTATPQTIDAA